MTQKKDVKICLKFQTQTDIHFIKKIHPNWRGYSVLFCGRTALRSLSLLCTCLLLVLGGTLSLEPTFLIAALPTPIVPWHYCTRVLTFAKFLLSFLYHSTIMLGIVFTIIVVSFKGKTRSISIILSLF